MIRLASVAAVLVISSWASVLATSDIASLRDRDTVTIEGVTTHVFGNRFILQDATGSALVDTGPHWFVQRVFKIGERLIVHGRLREQEFEAWKVTRGDGSFEVIRDRDGPPPWAVSKHSPSESKGE